MPDKVNGFLANCLLAIAIVIGLVCVMFYLHKDQILHTNSNRALCCDHDNFFKIAYIQLGNQPVQKIYIKEWRDYDDSDNIQITDLNGVVYLTNYNNVLMISQDIDLR